MNRDLKITVIVPVYNCEKYLSDCLDSILNQTWENLEIILIDDGSNDRSGKICDQYKKRDNRVKVVHQNNQGVSSARNAGLKLATGDIISFIDSDDTLELEMYEFLIQIMEENDVDIVHCGYKHIVGEEIRLIHDTKRIIKQNTDEALECLVGGHLFGGGLWSKLFRKELISDIVFRENLKINEDILFNFEAFRKSKTSVFADYAMYNYVARFGLSAVFKTPDEKKLQDSCEVSRYIYETLKESKLKDIASERYVRSLSEYYKYCMKNKPSSCKMIASTMTDVAKNAVDIGRNMTITVKLIRYCPWIYRIVNGVYTKIRKPQWEPRKD